MSVVKITILEIFTSAFYDVINYIVYKSLDPIGVLEDTFVSTSMIG